MLKLWWIVACVLQASSAVAQGWPYAGNTPGDTHAAVGSTINSGNVATLQPLWQAPTHGDVSATPTVEGNALYYTDWGGYVTRVDLATGQTVWQVKLSTITGNSGSLSRNAPAIGPNDVIVGDQASATFIALNKQTGQLDWKTLADHDGAAIITSSPVIAGNMIYAGVASSAEVYAIIPGYIPFFRGSVVALNLTTGQIVWQFHTVPPGYTGGGVWGSSPAYDPVSNTVYAGTGDNYTVPPGVSLCELLHPKNAISCLDANDWQDSVVALNAATGQLRWGVRLGGPDAWNAACDLLEPLCPRPTGPDYDFGAGPNLFTVPAGLNHPQPLPVLGIGQKSGVYWALDPATGKVLWSQDVGPGSSVGGIEWGTATDGTNVYVPINNHDYRSYALAGGGGTWTAGSWAALDGRTGQFKWQVPVPGNDLKTKKLALGLAGVTVANDVLFAGGTSGAMVALNAATGATLWQYQAAATVAAAPCVVGNMVIWGAGYSRLSIGTGGNVLYAFAIP